MSVQQRGPPSIHSELFDYFEPKLRGSSLQIVHGPTKDAIEIKAAEDLALRVQVNHAKKKIKYTLFSPKLNRSVRVEQINGFEFMEAKLEEELKNSNQEAIEADILLSIDLLRDWALKHDYSTSYEEAEGKTA